MTPHTEPPPYPASTQPAASRQAPAPARRWRSAHPAPGTSHRPVRPGRHRQDHVACLAPGPVAFIDLDESLPVLRVAAAAGRSTSAWSAASRTWQDMREALHADGWDEIRTIVIDSATKAEELCGALGAGNVKHENGKKAERWRTTATARGSATSTTRS